MMSLPKSLILLFAAVLTAAGCRQSTTPTAPTPLKPTINVFEGPLDRGSFATFLFSLSDRGTIVQAGLAGVTSRDGLRNLDETLRLTLGTITTEACDPVIAGDQMPALIAQAAIYMDYGLHCVSVTDPGTLSEDVNVVVRVDFPPLSGVVGTAGTETFSSNLPLLGRASRSFTAGRSGTATVTLGALSAPASTQVGLGLGLQGTGDSLCHLTQIVETSAGPSPQISAPIEPGIYCVSVFDIGELTTPLTGFSITIAHP